MNNLWQCLLNKAWKAYSGDVGKSLIHLGAIGWFFSSAAQLAMIASNKDIDKKEKKFLIAQETSDGVINVGLYYTICQCIKKFGENLIEKTKYITQSTSDIVQNFKNTSVSTSEFVNSTAEELRARGIIKKGSSKGNLSDFYKGLRTVFETKILGQPDLIPDTSVLKPVVDNILSKQTAEKTLEMLKTAKNEYSGFKNGVGVLTAVGASILACNIITPIARNITANCYQKRALDRQAKKHPQQNIKQLPSYSYNIPVPKTFGHFKI